MNTLTPVQYWRANKQWSQWLGKRGTVVASTLIRVAEGALAAWTPYPFVLVEFTDGTRHEYMGTGNQAYEPGDTVECVLRRLAVAGSHEVIPYGIKVQRIAQPTQPTPESVSPSPTHPEKIEPASPAPRPTESPTRSPSSAPAAGIR